MPVHQGLLTMSAMMHMRSGGRDAIRIPATLIFPQVVTQMEALMEVGMGEVEALTIVMVT